MYTTSKAGIDLIKLCEGWYSKPYLCPAGKPTIGWGTTFYPDGRSVSLSDPEITRAQGEIFLQHELQAIEKAINSAVKTLINQNQFDALVDFVYNFGITRFRESTLLKVINKNSMAEDVKIQFRRWVYVENPKTGKMEVSDGQIKRAERRIKLYFK